MSSLPPGFTPTGNLAGSSSGTLAAFSSSLASQVVLTNNSRRVGAIFYNASSQPAYYAHAATCSLGMYTGQIPASSSLAFPTPIYCGTVAVTWQTAGSGLLFVTEDQ